MAYLYLIYHSLDKPIDYTQSHSQNKNTAVRATQTQLPPWHAGGEPPRGVKVDP